MAASSGLIASGTDGRLKLVRAVVLLSLLAVVVANSEEHRVTGLAGGSVTISCFGDNDTAPPSGTTVEWFDRVYTETADPILIYRSAANPSRTPDPDHPNSDDYAIDTRHRLTISKLDLEYDAGLYFCRRTTPSGTISERQYDLSVTGKPECSGPAVTRVKVGTAVKFSCKMPYSGGQPSLNWMADQDTVDSKDMFDVGMAMKELELRATEADDQKPYRCVAQLNDIVSECSITLTVPYAVRDVALTPSKKVLQVGDELRCTARGNPVPQISLTPTIDGKETAGVGWKSIRVPDDWLAQAKTIKCVAVNDVDGKATRVEAELTFNVTAKATVSGGSGASSMIHTTSAILLFLSSLLSALVLLH